MKPGLIGAVEELVERVAKAIRPGQVVDAFLAGGTATCIHLQRAGGAAVAEARFSEDADVHFNRRLALADDIVVRYADADGEDRVLVLDRTYTIEIGLRHPDCFDDAIHLLDSQNGRLRLHILSPLDLAVTKVGRFQDHDRQDISLLARAGLVESTAFGRRAQEALEYLAADPSPVEFNIAQASEQIQCACR
ncbi:MAG: DUF6036 family nucleotidyltransferase [Wenzhouxiangellaceae bacterium]|nr:DUF6036 family nucleotidyltransferase [Wenzhouxiangellaceae bacterium]